MIFRAVETIPETLCNLCQALITHIEFIRHHQAFHSGNVEIIESFRGMADSIYQRSMQIVRRSIFPRLSQTVIVQRGYHVHLRHCRQRLIPILPERTGNRPADLSTGILQLLTEALLPVLRRLCFFGLRKDPDGLSADISVIIVQQLLCQSRSHCVMIRLCDR